MKKALKLVLAALVIAAMAICFAACGEDEHTHTPVKTAAKAADCDTDGNIEHWSCSCGKLFSDQACTKELSANDVKLSAKGHKPEADDGDCTTAVKCTVCDAVTTDRKGAHFPEVDDGDCTTARKCSVCDKIAIEAKALHTPEEDDGDCTTERKCVRCESIVVEAKAAHTPSADDGDCTTAIKCADCDTVTTAAKAAHTPSADDGDCTTARECSVCDKIAIEAKAAHTQGADDGDCTTDITCIDCEHVFVAGKAHDFDSNWNATHEDHWHKCLNEGCDAKDSLGNHIPEEDDGDCTTALLCKDCGWGLVEANESHTPEEDDGDCTTAIKCVDCDSVTTVAKTAHTPEDDDGDCTTAQGCADCEGVAVEAREAHTDEDVNGVCDHCSYECDYTYIDDTYYIFTFEGLYAFAENAWSGADAVLMNDIVMPEEMSFDLDGDGENESNWEQINLSGSFDGNGYSITGIRTVNATRSSIAFIDSLFGTVKDLHLKDVYIVGNSRVGGIVADNYGTISGCSVSGYVLANENDAGGIAGYNSTNGLIIGCRNSADVCALNGSAAGICPQINSDHGVTACYNTGKITSAEYSANGISANVYSGSVIGCYSVGVIEGNNKYGIASYVDSDDGALRGCYFGATGELTAGDYRDLGTYSAITLVDGETVDWSDAMEQMNAVLTENGSAFRYEINEGEDSDTRPLTLVEITE